MLCAWLCGVITLICGPLASVRAVLHGAVPRAVFASAVKSDALVENIDFRLECLNLFRLFENTELCIDDVYERFVCGGMIEALLLIFFRSLRSLREDFPTSERCAAVYASRALETLLAAANRDKETPTRFA